MSRAMSESISSDRFNFDRPIDKVRHRLSGITTLDRIGFKRRTLHERNVLCLTPSHSL